MRIFHIKSNAAVNQPIRRVDSALNIRNALRIALLYVFDTPVSRIFEIAHSNSYAVTLVPRTKIIFIILFEIQIVFNEHI